MKSVMCFMWTNTAGKQNHICQDLWIPDSCYRVITVGFIYEFVKLYCFIVCTFVLSVLYPSGFFAIMSSHRLGLVIIMHIVISCDEMFFT